MAKLFNTTDLINTHRQLRSIVSVISKEVTSVRKQAAQAREDAEKVYANVEMGKAEKRNLITQHVKAQVDTTAKPTREKIKPMLRQMEGIRLKIEEARDNMTNPIRRLNAITLMDTKHVASRHAAMEMFSGMGAAELEVAAEAAKTSGDLGMLAAIVSKNNQLKPSDRTFNNADLLTDVKLPGQDDIDAVFAEVVSLPAYAIACDRAFDTLGDIKPRDRLEIGLAERQININEDGSLADFQTTEAPRYKVDGTEYIQPDKPKSDDEEVDPMDFDSFAAFIEGGGSTDTELSNEVMTKWYGDGGENKGTAPIPKEDDAA